MSEQPRIIAEFVDYSGMLDGLRARVRELNVHGERFDEFAGLPQGYLSKLIGMRPVKRIGMNSLGPLLDALGLKCVLVENEETTKRLKNRVKSRNPNLVRAGSTHVVLTWRFMQKIQRAGGRARAIKMTPAQRRRSARKAARMRWLKQREAEAKREAIRSATMDKRKSQCEKPAPIKGSREIQTSV